MNAQPPKWTRALLMALLAPRDRETIPGDLLEAYRERLAGGHARANWWHLQQVLSIAWHVAPRSPKKSDVSVGLLLGLVMAVAIVVTNVLLPLAHRDLPEDTVTSVLAWGAPFLVMGGAGWRAWRRDGMRRALRAGGIIALLAFGGAMATFAIVDNVFLDLMRQQPEKLWLLQRSGYSDMRMAINAGHLRALVFVLPVLSLLGVLAGGVGGFVARLQRVR